MKNWSTLVVIFLLFACNRKEQKVSVVVKDDKIEATEPSLQLSDTLVIAEDFSIAYLKLNSLEYHEFSKKDKTQFIESRTGGLDCGEGPPVLSSIINLKNDTIGLTLEFSSSWLENSNAVVEKLSQITLNRTKAKFSNGITLGKSNIEETKTNFGKPEKEGENLLFYTFETNKIILIFNELGLLEYVSMNSTY